MRRLILILFFHIAIISNVQVVSADNSVIMRLHGSNTIGAKLGPELVKVWLRREGYSRIRSKSRIAEEQYIMAQDKYGNEKIVEILSHGSSTGFKSLLAGVTDIAMSSRPIKPKEVVKLKSQGDMTQMESEYVIGLDGIAVIVHKDNPLSALNKETIKQIFSGTVTHWQQVSNELNGKINVYARDNKSGTYDTFKALVLGKKVPLVKGANRYESNADLSDDVAKDPMGIGFVGLPYVRDSKAVAIAEKGALEKAPAAFDVATEDYPLSRRLYMYIPGAKHSRHVQSFIDFVMSRQGQDVVASTGFISQNLEAREIAANDGFPQEYLKYTKNAERLSLNFRFRKNSTTLDNKGQRDIARLVEFMSRKENRRKKIMLFGFSDPAESLPIFSQDLSVYRVDWVSSLLAKHKIRSYKVRGYGDAIPVASNEDAGGRNKNRRVEVWFE